MARKVKIVWGRNIYKNVCYHGWTKGADKQLSTLCLIGTPATRGEFLKTDQRPPVQMKLCAKCCALADELIAAGTHCE